MSDRLVEIHLFGACTVRSIARPGYELLGTKHRALFALLATAPSGRRSRNYLQETLWGSSCYDTGRQSLRRALSDIKMLMGCDFASVLAVNNADVTLNFDRVRMVGAPGASAFLEGLDVRTPAFQRFLVEMRETPAIVSRLVASQLRSVNGSAFRPTVSVIPFRAWSDDPSDAVLGDWLAEETCRSLSRTSLLTVISHLSCRRLCDGIIDMAAVRKELAADYCLAGTLRRTGLDLRLDADFIDTRTGQILWTRGFSHAANRFLGDAYGGIPELVEAVGRAIASTSIRHVRGLTPSDIDDHRLVIAGVGLMHCSTLHEFARSKELIEEALRRAPRAPELHAWLAKWYVLSVFNRWGSNAAAETAQAVDCCARALDLDPDDPFALTIDGFAHNNLLRRMDVAERRYAAALDRNPNGALSWLLQGVLHAFRDEGGLAVEATAKARRISPLDPFGYFYDSLDATACLSDGDYERALDLADRSLAQNDRHLSTLRTKIVALHRLGRDNEASDAGRALLQRQPDFNVSSYLKSHPAADYRFGREAARALSAAGIP